MAQQSRGRPAGPRAASDEYGLPIAAVINENWQGKSDPTERRRIQNRLNQRNYRARRRANSQPKQDKSGNQPERQTSNDEGVGEDNKPAPSSSKPFPDRRSLSAPAAAGQPQGETDPLAGYVWDELAQLINRNFMQAALTNAQHLGIDVEALQTGELIYTPRLSGHAIPTALAPSEVQYQVAHDPVFDIIPHHRLRHNILRAVAAQQVDAAVLSRCIRASGALENVEGAWQRGGFVVWSSAEQLTSWELSEPFVTQWYWLLQGCEDLLAVTNAWRSRRGERQFPTLLCPADS